jgi:hypothetical protein
MRIDMIATCCSVGRGSPTEPVVRKALHYREPSSSTYLTSFLYIRPYPPHRSLTEVHGSDVRASFPFRYARASNTRLPLRLTEALVRTASNPGGD